VILLLATNEIPLSLLNKALVLGWVLGICYFQARYQARRFKQNKSISHIGKMLLFCLYALVPLVYIYVETACWKTVIQGALQVVITRVACYDPILNYYRIPRRPFWYNGNLNVQGSLWDAIKNRQSVLDWLENHLSLFWIKVLKVSYCMVLIFILIF
jgi:hypothetical protein